MTILLDTPDTLCPSPVENCVEFKISVDEAFLACRPTRITLGILANPGMVGFCFDILGETFTVNCGSSFTANSFCNGPDVTTAASNLQNMLLSNFTITNNFVDVDIVVNDDYAIVTMESIICGPLPEPLIKNNKTQAIENGFIITGIQGTNSRFRSGACIGWQLWSKTLNRPINKSLQVFCQKFTDEAPIPLCLDFQETLSSYVDSTFPTQYTEAFSDEAMKHEFCIYHGPVVFGEDCEIEKGIFTFSDSFSVINSAIQYADPIGFRPYCYRGNDGEFRFACFLTNNPNTHVCADSYQWLTLCADLNAFVQSELEDAFDYQVVWDFPELNQSNSQTFENDGVFVIPAGPAQMPDGITEYSITVFFDVPLFGVTMQMSKTMTYKIVECNCCGDPIEIHFKNTLGGWDPLTFGCVENISLSSEAIEICTDTQCDYDKNLLNSGKSFKTTGVDKFLTLVAYVDNTPENIKWLEELKGSSCFKAKILDAAGNVKFTTFSLQGSINIFLDEGEIVVTLQGFYGLPLNTLS